MFEVKRGELVKICTAGGEVKGMVIDSNADKVSIGYRGKVTQVAWQAVETIEPCPNTNDSEFAFAFVSGIMGVFAVGAILGVGILVGWKIWGGG